MSPEQTDHCDDVAITAQASLGQLQKEKTFHEPVNAGKQTFATANSSTQSAHAIQHGNKDN